MIAFSKRCLLVALLFLATPFPTSGAPRTNNSGSAVLSAVGDETARQNAWLDWLATVLYPFVTTTTPITSITNITTITSTPTSTTYFPSSSSSSISSTSTTPTTPHRNCHACSCGNVNMVRRIVGGQETVVHAYPWMALLLSDGEFYCGATLINDLYVVTAAHCLSGVKAGAIMVRLLEHDRQNTSVYVINRRVVRTLIHERYNSKTYDNDLGLIRLSKPVKFNERLRPICMPSEGNDFVGELALITGWGALSQGGDISDTLQEVEVPVLSQQDCYKSKYGPDRITENMLCAGLLEGGKDSCQGDSGGPLHVRLGEMKEHQLAGIVSWGEGCAQANAPGVYTRVNRFTAWIMQHTADGCGCSGENLITANEMTENANTSALNVTMLVASETTTNSIIDIFGVSTETNTKLRFSRH